MLHWSTTSSYQFTKDFRNPSISTDQLVNNSLNSYLDQKFTPNNNNSSNQFINDLRNTSNSTSQLVDNSINRSLDNLNKPYKSNPLNETVNRLSLTPNYDNRSYVATINTGQSNNIGKLNNNLQSNPHSKKNKNRPKYKYTPNQNTQNRYTGSNKPTTIMDTITKKYDKLNNVNNTYINDMILSQTAHFTAILAASSYELTKDGSSDKFMNKLQDYGNKYQIHQNTINNLTVLESNTEYIVLRDESLVNIDGNTGHVCYTVFRGTDFSTVKSSVKDGLNDAMIASGLQPSSSHEYNNKMSKILTDHPECIYNIATGHSLGGANAYYTSHHYDKVNTWNRGSVPHSRITNQVVFNNNENIDRSNVTDYNVSCDWFSMGTGPNNGNRVHLTKSFDGVLSCHSMDSFIENATIIQDRIELEDGSYLISGENDFDRLITIFEKKYIEKYSTPNYDHKHLLDKSINQESPVQGTPNHVLPVQVSSDNKTKSEKTEEKKDTFQSDVANNLNYLNQGLNVIKGIKDWDKLNEEQKALFIASTMLIQIKNIANDSLDVFSNMILTYLQDNKIRIENLVIDVCQKYFHVPLNGTRNLIDSILHKGKNSEEAIELLFKEIAICAIPYAQVAFIVYQTCVIIKSLLTKISVIEIGGIPALREVSDYVTSSKGKHKKVTLTNKLLDIKVSSRNKNKNNADADVKAKFEQEAKIKAYQVYGIDYDFFNDNVPANRYEEYKKMLYFKLIQEYWKKINNLTPKEIKKYEISMFESDEVKTKRIKYKLLGKKFSYYELNKNKNIYHFICDLKTDFLKCNNNTERAMFLFSLFYETGHSKNDQVKFSEFTSYILKLFNINISQFLTYINYENDYSNKFSKYIDHPKVNSLDEQIKIKKQEGNKNFEEFLEELKKIRNKANNNSLNEYNNQQKNDMNNNQNEYSIEKIRYFVHRELIKHEISTEFIYQITSSSITSNLLFSLVYIDKEYLRIRNEGGMYIPNKSLEITCGCIQSFGTTIIADHISVDLKLKPFLFFISNEIFDNVISPNIQLMTSYGVSSIIHRNNDNTNMGRKIFDITENVLKTNSINLMKGFSKTTLFVDTLIEKNITSYSKLKTLILGVLGSSGTELAVADRSLLYWALGSSVCQSLLIMIASRVIKNIIFPEVKPKRVDLQNVINIELRKKDLLKLIKNLSNKNVSNLKKIATKRELQLNGVIEFDKIPIKSTKNYRKHNIYYGKDLIF